MGVCCRKATAHISTFALFLIAMFVLGCFMAILFSFIVSMRKAKQGYAAPGDLEARIRARQEELGGRPYEVPPRSTFSSAPGAYAAPPAMAAAPVYMHGGSSSDLFTGALLGEVLAGAGHHDTTVIHETAPVHDAPAYDSSPSFDSGISYDSGPVCDSGGGGVDISW
jgi:hypothetical protein